MKGRIYEDRCDISPDGRHFVYFAMNGRWKSETRGSWTAISGVPYLKALSLYPQGDTYGGGGLWLDDRAVWLNACPTSAPLRESTAFRRTTSNAFAEYCRPHWPGHYEVRLLRDGWRRTDRSLSGDPRSTVVFEKVVDRRWRLRKYESPVVAADGKAPKPCFWELHRLVHERSGVVVDCPDWEWADMDCSRLVWAADGKLFTGTPTLDGLQDIRELYNFNGMAFIQVTAPY